ncbi:MAG: hydrogenase maturation nickel metallochaperone HypA [Candidatus Hydrogenedentes bacterium]|nr:hydrogenase maturation nickel metallochaperone HypA [Candidatus Hydrogenedentota bacterium]
MHELAIVKRILDLALDVSRENGALPIARVAVDVGALQNVVPEMMSFAFTAISVGTDAEGAEFDWTEVPAEVVCESCEAMFRPEAPMWTCPECGAGGGRVVRGDELVLRSVTLRE